MYNIKEIEKYYFINKDSYTVLKGETRYFLMNIKHKESQNIIHTFKWSYNLINGLINFKEGLNKCVENYFKENKIKLN